MKTYKGVYYFPDNRTKQTGRRAAHYYAVKHGWPTNRIISFSYGHAIQLRSGGPYVGPKMDSDDYADLYIFSHCDPQYKKPHIWGFMNSYICYPVLYLAGHLHDYDSKDCYSHK